MVTMIYMSHHVSQFLQEGCSLHLIVLQICFMHGVVAASLVHI